MSSFLVEDGASIMHEQVQSPESQLRQVDGRSRGVPAALKSNIKTSNASESALRGCVDKLSRRVETFGYGRCRASEE